ncbi:histidine phosphatase superfamily [Blastocladiella britannica]|nr:histidine phosphatase superfamily [Blastocladiella britannica]
MADDDEALLQSGTSAVNNGNNNRRRVASPRSLNGNTAKSSTPTAPLLLIRSRPGEQTTRRPSWTALGLGLVLSGVAFFALVMRGTAPLPPDAARYANPAAHAPTNENGPPLPLSAVASNWSYCEAPLRSPPPTPGWLAGAQLHHVFVFVRHGDRTPYWWPSRDHAPFEARVTAATPREDLPMWDGCDHPVIPAWGTVTHDEEPPAWHGGCRLGQLTSLGAAQLRQAGKWYARVYRALLDDGGELSVRSTDYNRTIASGMHFIRGVVRHPPGMPAPPSEMVYHPRDPATDPLSLSNPALNRTIFSYFSIPEDLPLLSPMQEQRIGPTAKNTKKLSLSPWTAKSFGRLFDVLATTRCHAIATCFPLVADQDLCLAPRDVDRVLKWSGSQFSRIGREFYDATGGRAIRELVLERTRGNSSTLPRGMSVYATHDTTLGVILRALGHPTSEWPAYASQVAVEAWRVGGDTGEWRLRALYNGEEVCAGGPCPILA